MSFGFTFPPPPPPPPTTSGNPPSTVGNGDRGRGRWPTRARGRGSVPQYARGAHGRRSADWDRPQHNQTGQPTRPFFYTATKRSPVGGQKRDHNQAFHQGRRADPLGKAPPAVPSFGLPLPVLPTPPAQNKGPLEPKKKKDRTFNQLGLTPRKEEHESSEEEDDEGEESRLAAASLKFGQKGLQFEHQGQVLSLSSPQDIAAWIAERKRRFPTKARIAETLAVKAKELDQPRRVQADHRRQRQQPREATRKLKKEHPWPGPQTRDQKGQKQNMHAVTGVKRGKRRGDYQLGRTDALSRDISDGEVETSDETSSDGVSDDECTSSSGSSEASNSSDEAPAEQSSKVPVPAIEAAKAELSQKIKTNKVCKYMLKSGKCRKGKQCRYRHDVLSDEFWSSMNNDCLEAEGPTKLSLYERLLAQQRDQEDREILHCIIHLGDRGLLC